MIIKFKTRKNIYSARQLVTYILTDKGRIKNPLEAPIVLQNINRLELETMHRDFIDNYKYQSKRKGSVAIYQEILAISKKDREHITKEMIQDFMYKYIELRGLQNALVIAKSHEDHIHFMIGSNELRSKKRLRMSQAEMKTLLREFELYHKSKYPELENSLVHTIKTPQKKRDIASENRNNRCEKEYQLKIRLGDKKTQKEVVTEIVNELLQKAANFSQLVHYIKQTKGLEIYAYRGKIRGVLFNNMKWRFSTLGISKEKLLQLEKVQDRLNELALIKEMHKPTREKTHER